jgi:microcystin-dependent protein
MRIATVKMSQAIIARLSVHPAVRRRHADMLGDTGGSQPHDSIQPYLAPSGIFPPRT